MKGSLPPAIKRHAYCKAPSRLHQASCRLGSGRFEGPAHGKASGFAGEYLLATGTSV